MSREPVRVTSFLCFFFFGELSRIEAMCVSCTCCLNFWRIDCLGVALTIVKKFDLLRRVRGNMFSSWQL